MRYREVCVEAFGYELPERVVTSQSLKERLAPVYAKMDRSLFDISNACLGFINGMVTLANMIELGQIKAGVVVACESGTRLTDATIG